MSNYPRATSRAQSASPPAQTISHLSTPVVAGNNVAQADAITRIIAETQLGLTPGFAQASVGLA